jgi:high potential iron-sulfur protein
MNKTELSRRLVLHRAMTVAAGAAAVVGVTANRAVAQAKNSQQTVAYQDKPQGSQRCDNCTLFEPPSACKTVDGQISPQGWCKIYAAKPN